MLATVKIKRPKSVSMISVESGTPVYEILQTEGFEHDMPCGGNGKCLRCGIKASGGLSEPDEAEIRAFGESGLADGWRLSCRARVISDSVIYAPEAQIFDNILSTGHVSGQIGGVPLYRDWGAAVDIGTTTLSARLYGKDGFCGAVSMKNPQTAFGADVITRIEKSIAGHSRALADAVLGAVSAMFEKLTRAQNIGADDIDALVITGNTAMLYLLTERDPVSLSRAPFEADTLFGDFYKLPYINAKAYLPRCISAFIGADITTAILVCGMCESGETSLLADIGTNGEIALWHKGKLYCSSTAAGPAFEGAGIYMGSYGVSGAVDKVWLENGVVRSSVIGGVEPSGICGSGITDAVAVMLKAGIIDETGAMMEDEHDFTGSLTHVNGILAFGLCGNVVVTARDIRSIQLAKGAVRAGIETLLSAAGVGYSDISKLYIAGGFGEYLNLESAAAIGLIPVELVRKAVACGNAAQAGAAMLLTNKDLLAESVKLAEMAETIDLSANPVFTENYMHWMMFTA